MRYKVVSIERNKDDDGGMVVCHRCIKKEGQYMPTPKKGMIVFRMDTNLPEIGDIVTATFNWRSNPRRSDYWERHHE